MEPICSKCGMENNNRKGAPYYLTDDIILCSECIEPIIYEIHELRGVNDVGEYISLSKKILDKSKDLYGDKITSLLALEFKRLGVRKGFVRRSEMAVEEAPREQDESDFEETESGMFSNIGKKIKVYAQVLTWIGIIGFTVWGLMICFSEGELSFVRGIVIAVSGSLGSWLSCLCLYGFGQLVDNSDKLVRLLSKKWK